MKNFQEDDWTEALDLIEERDQLGQQGTLKYLIERYEKPPENLSISTYSLEVYIKQQENETSVVNEKKMIQTIRRVAFDFSKIVYEKLNIDQTKCILYKEMLPKDENSKQTYIKKVVIQLGKNQNVETSKYEDYL